MGIDLSNIPLPECNGASAEEWWTPSEVRAILADRRAVALAVLEAAANVCESTQRMSGDPTTFYIAIGQAAKAIRALGKDLV